MARFAFEKVPLPTGSIARKHPERSIEATERSIEDLVASRVGDDGNLDSDTGGRTGDK